MAKILKVRDLWQDDSYPVLKGVLLGLLIIGIMAAVLNSRLFALREFSVEGNSRVSDEDIMEDLELSYGTNLFRYALAHINNTPKVDPRLTTVDVYFRWPGRVEVVVEESETIGYIYFQGTYLCIDRKGQVAASTETPDEDLPVIVGLEVGSFSIGETLSTRDKEKYSAVVLIGAALRKYDLAREIDEVNIRNLDDIILKTLRLEIHVGGMTDMEQKINIVAAIMAEPQLPKGVLHIEDLSSQIYISTTGE